MEPVSFLVLFGATLGASWLYNRVSEESNTFTPDHHDEHDGELEPPPTGIEVHDQEPCPVPMKGFGPDGAGSPFLQPDSVLQMPPLLQGNEQCPHPDTVKPRGFQGTPMAGGNPKGWVVNSTNRRKWEISYTDVNDKFHGAWGRQFGALRTLKERDKQGGVNVIKRRHAGVDLFAMPGDPVLASEPGTILAILPFTKGTWALYLLTDTGLILNYGEIRKNSWQKYGISKGTRVVTGDKLADVGTLGSGSFMLHFETYVAEPDLEAQVQAIRAEKFRWVEPTPLNQSILDPTAYLVQARYQAAKNEII